ncbi:hypothetical protein ABTZ58_23850 [Streptomyces sp. NPDC094143]|uniref:trypsin-like serine peptidase n=1 Tax=Streptomyces sp. NPDC094143 TaxID=3155310 RepID=UPI00332CA43F
MTFHPAPARGPAVRHGGGTRTLRAVALLLVAVFASACTIGGDDTPEGDWARTDVWSREDSWRHGGWQDWSPQTWARAASGFRNPVIEQVWNARRLGEARQRGKAMARSAAAVRGLAGTASEPSAAAGSGSPSHLAAVLPVGRVFFDTPEGPSFCSGTVVQDPGRPGRSNLVWTAGHCVHAGKEGGWFRNVVFVPHGSDLTQPPRAGSAADAWWAEDAAVSEKWIAEGTARGAGGAFADFAVLRVDPGPGRAGTSLQEAVGGALPVAFDHSRPPGKVTAVTGGGLAGSSCTGRPGPLSLRGAGPDTLGMRCAAPDGTTSGGGWFASGADGGLVLVSHTSVRSAPTGWIAGPRLGREAQSVFTALRRRS